MNETVERYSTTGTLLSGPYLFQPIGLPEFWDIGFMDGDIWYACDDSDSPIKAFSTGGALTDYVMDTVIPAAHGLCFEDDQFLWASDIYADQLYRINLNPTGIEGGDIQPDVTLSPSLNPFSASVTLQGTGFSQSASLEIYDVMGRMVLATGFDGAFTWAGTDADGNNVPSGTYVIRVTDGSLTESLTLLRL